MILLFNPLKLQVESNSSLLFIPLIIRYKYHQMCAGSEEGSQSVFI